MRAVLIAVWILILAAPAVANTVFVEWKGIATSYWHEEFDPDSEWPERILESIHVSVSGSVLIETDDFVPKSYNPKQFSAGPADVGWSLTIDDPFFNELFGTAESAFAFDGGCDACMYSVDPFYFYGDADPEAFAEVSLKTGRWITAFLKYVYPQEVELTSGLYGIVTSATISPANPIPEPGAALLFVAGVAVLLTNRR